MSDKYKYDEYFRVIAVTPSGKEIVVANANDPYWADAIAYALNFARTEEW